MLPMFSQFLQKTRVNELKMFTDPYMQFEERKPSITCGSLKLALLCTVLRRKIHISVRTPKWPPRLNFTGACHGH